MKAISRFEANLLNILRFFLRKAPVAQAEPLILKAMPPPACLSRAAVELVQDTLAKGCMLLLASHGDGWKPARFLRNGQVVPGRLWERTPPAALGLTFSKHSMRFLIWTTAMEQPAKPRVQPPREELQTGDLVLFYFAYAALRALPLASMGLSRQNIYSGNALCRLAFPSDFAETDKVPDFAPWSTGVGACVLEALQGELCEHWITAEQDKARQVSAKVLRGIGQAQESVLAAFLDAMEAAGRRDLARFVLQAARNILGGRDQPYVWMESLELSRERLADRAATYRSILALPRQFQRLSGWEQRARTVGYFDEEYAASQLWKSDWEQARGEELRLRSTEILRRWEEWR